jgi:hypothetical protein
MLMFMLVAVALTYVVTWHAEGGGYRALAIAAFIGAASVSLWVCTVPVSGEEWVP